MFWFVSINKLSMSKTGWKPQSISRVTECNFLCACSGIIVVFIMMTVPLPSTESHRWQPEIQLWCAHEQWLFSAELHSYCTSGSVCWTFSASIRLVPYITKRRYVSSLNELPSALLQRWSDLHKPLSMAKAEDARHQQCESVSPASCGYQSTEEVPPGSHGGTFCSQLSL